MEMRKANKLIVSTCISSPVIVCPLFFKLNSSIKVEASNHAEASAPPVLPENGGVFYRMPNILLDSKFFTS